METAKEAKPDKSEKKVVKRLIVFQGNEYDLNNLTKEQREFLAQFPEEVPYLK
jgi:hypothetical protein